MRSRRYLGWTALILALLLLPARGMAQDATGYALPDTFLPTPLSSTRPEEGLFFGGTWGLYQQTMPLGTQVIAVRGFKDVEGTITGIPGAFVGSGNPALSTKQVTGPSSLDPAFRIFGGYRFFDGSSIELDWLHLSTNRYSAVATPIPKNLIVGADFSESFLTSPVANYPLDFSGPGNDINGVAAFGIWNAADLMTESYTQRTEVYELLYRLPAFYESENYRTAFFFGPRLAWLWENFQWKTFDFDANGQSASVWNGFYTNTVSNRLYGIKMGCSSDWYIGNGFAITFEPYVTPMIDFVKEVAKYERGDLHTGPERKRAITDTTLVPNVGASVSVDWYPYEGIQVKAGYNLDAFFNTKTSLHPVDFDYSGLTPQYNHQVLRVLRGFEIGVAIRF